MNILKEDMDYTMHKNKLASDPMLDKTYKCQCTKHKILQPNYFGYNSISNLKLGESEG